MRDSGRVSSRGLVPALTLAAVALSLFAPAAGAQAGRRGGHADAPAYAAAMGVPLPEAERRLRLQLELSAVENRLREKAGDIFAGLWLEHRPTFSVQVRFTDLARGRELLAPLAAGFGADFEAAAAAASLAQLETLQEELLGRLRAERVAADADIDLRENRVELLTTTPEAAAASLAGLPSAAAGRYLLVPAAGLSTLDAAILPIRGGRPLTTCTSGFTARNDGGSVGILTSGHCGNEQEYPDWDLPMTYVAGQFSGSRDVQFHNRHCNMKAPNEFDSGAGIRLVTATRSRDQQVVGSQVCANGITSGYRCGLISSKNYCPGSVPSCASTWIRVQPTNGQPLSASGDSGGPWFADTYAYGINSGHVGNDAFYMAVNYAATVAPVLTVDAGGGHLTGHMTCDGNHLGSPMVSCAAGMTGGVGGFTTSVWGYWGDAESWSTYFNTGRAHYSFGGGCPPNAKNYFSVQITDSCGTIGGATGYAPCPASCFTPGGEDSLLPPVCGFSPNDRAPDLARKAP